MTQSKMACMDRINVDVEVGFSEVVNVFITQYETALHEEKERLMVEMREVKANMKALVDQVSAYLQKPVKVKYTKSNDWGLTAKVGDVNIDWKDGTGKINVEISDESAKRHSYSINKEIQSTIKQADVDRYSAYQMEIGMLDADFRDVHAKIRDISRKERQVRGEISKRKLESAGMSELLNNQDLLKLIEIK